jgi:phosphoribosylformylglycinamidine synthase
MLAESAPEYDPESKRPAYLDELDVNDAPSTFDNDVYLELLADSNICSREWIYRQYDHQVQNNTLIKPGGDAAVIRIGDTGRGRMTNMGLAISTDCNGHYCYLDPFRGAQIALAEGIRNLACVGATPLAITDCLNFGSPEKPEVFWQFEQAVDGLNGACRYFGIPVVSGNVSFYNESFGQAIYPTPAIGIVGKVADLSRTCTTAFKQEGDLIFLLGKTLDEPMGCLPTLDLDQEKAVCDLVRSLIEQGKLQSAHDLSEGGLPVSLAESCLAGGLGADILYNPAEFGLDAASGLISESQSRVLVSVKSEDAAALAQAAEQAGVTCIQLGTVAGDAIGIKVLQWPPQHLGQTFQELPRYSLIGLSLSQVGEAYQGTLPRVMGQA